MTLEFRFAVVSDLHVGLPETIWQHPQRFHLIEVAIPAFEQILEHLETEALDALFLPGDLVQHGERRNHTWLARRLARLPYPVYVVPGNHDLPQMPRDGDRIRPQEFPGLYARHGYADGDCLWYSRTLAPSLQLIGLNSNAYREDGEVVGRIDGEQLVWLAAELERCRDRFVIVMLHHNLLNHLPRQARHPLGRRYILENAPELLALLSGAGVELVLTGHLHVQSLRRHGRLRELTTGSLVSYPHPYRLCCLQRDDEGHTRLSVTSHRIEAVPQFEQLQQFSRQWMGDRSEAFMRRLLTRGEAALSAAEADPWLPELRHFWAELAAGDRHFRFGHMPPPLRRFLEDHGNSAGDDNHSCITWTPKRDGLPQAV
jgi:predicted phosphodiesterase